MHSPTPIYLLLLPLPPLILSNHIHMEREREREMLIDGKVMMMKRTLYSQDSVPLSFC